VPVEPVATAVQARFAPVAPPVQARVDAVATAVEALGQAFVAAPVGARGPAVQALVDAIAASVQALVDVFPAPIQAAVDAIAEIAGGGRARDQQGQSHRGRQPRFQGRDLHRRAPSAGDSCGMDNAAAANRLTRRRPRSVVVMMAATTGEGRMADAFVMLYIFMLAAIAGHVIISRVPVILHTPLMSGSNFIHGIVLIGAMVVLGHADTTLEKAIGFAAVLLGAGNAAGGYVVTERMLEMFKASKKPEPKA
jgi:NAD(P) transhydrogenase subunit alpha